MIRFLLIRHGESLSNLGNYFTGQLDVDLTPLGYEQAELTAAFIAENYRVDAIVSSDLQRARHTVDALSRVLGMPYVTDVGLRELFGGEFEGVTYEILRRNWTEPYGHWVRDIGTASPPGGETMAEVQVRGEAALRRLAAKTADGSVVAVGTHAAFIRTLMCRWKGLPLGEMKNIPWVANASVTEVDYDGECFRLARENLCAHLGTLRTDIPPNV